MTETTENALLEVLRESNDCMDASSKKKTRVYVGLNGVNIPLEADHLIRNHDYLLGCDQTGTYIYK